MSAKLRGLRTIGEITNPRTLVQLNKAGLLQPKGAVALAKTLPWLIGRGPSIGILAQINAGSLADKVAVKDRNGSVSWRDLDARANRFTQLLEAHGVEPGQRIALLLRNGREMAEILIAAQKLGVVACPLNTWAKTKELEATLTNSEPRLLVYDTAHTQQVKAVTPGGLLSLFVGDESKALPGSLPYETELFEHGAAPPVPFTRRRGSSKIVIHTSGTTGTPKGASRDSSSVGLGALANLLSVVPYRRDDLVFCPAPMFHSFGLATFLVGAGLGATLILPEKFEPEASLKAIEEHGATTASFVPVMVKRILELPEATRKRYDLSSLRIVLCSGSAMSPEMRRGAMDVFGDVLYDLYGSTEAGWVTIATPPDLRSRPSTVGRPVPGVEVAVFSPEGTRLPPGEVGELYVRSGVAFEGYTSGETRDQREGHMSLGDLGYVDEDGYLFVQGRADDMVVVGGENVYPIEVENIIESIDGVNEAAVFGVPDPEYGQSLVAFFAGPADPEEVRSVCRDELASYKVPRRIERLAELPRTSTGKILKRELLEL